jgi:DNA-3-methyladenine glycosylase I
MKRCSWANSQIMKDYHDNVWGKEQHDDQQLFKMLILEGLQAGLSWEIILKKEKDYEKAIDHFDYYKIALYDENKLNELLLNPKLIRNKIKMNSIITNAKAFIKVIEEYGSFDHYIWAYVNYKQIDHQYHTSKEIPSYDELSTKISNDLKKKGFKFVGPTIIYSYMQAIGMINDHELTCEYR